MVKSGKLGFVCYVIMPDGANVPVDDLPAEVRAQWQANMCRNLSRDLSGHYTQHPEEYAAVPEYKGA